VKLQPAELESRFQKFDSNADGKLDEGEFKKLLDSLGVAITREFALIAFSAIDVDGNGNIDFPEFSGWWQKQSLDAD
jgi:Ca2+-binding EF-hand superfamily protein